jgi:hypothetical protein
MPLVFLEIALFLFFFAFSVQAGKRMKVRQASRLADYRKSPKSHQLHLND